MSKVTKEKVKFHCDVCFRSLASKRGVRKHKRKCHSSTSKEYKYECPSCQRRFYGQCSLTNHKWREHPPQDGSIRPPKVIRPRKLEKQCPLCEACFNKDLILSHFEQVHDITLCREQKAFESFAAFERWKVKMEKATKSSYVKYGGFKPYKSISKTYYNCHRSGHFISESNGARQPRTRGSIKINGYCPSRMEVELDNTGKCTVYFLKTHVGHENDVHCLFLTPSERMIIAEKIAANMTNDEILRDLKQTYTDPEYERIRLVKRHDITNIKRWMNMPLTTKGKRQSNLSDIELDDFPDDNYNVDSVQYEIIEDNSIRNDELVVEGGDIRYEVVEPAASADTLNVVEDTDSGMAILNLESSGMTYLDLIKRKEKLKRKFSEAINNIANLDEYRLFKKAYISLLQDVDALHNPSKLKQNAAICASNNPNVNVQNGLTMDNLNGIAQDILLQMNAESSGAETPAKRTKTEDIPIAPTPAVTNIVWEVGKPVQINPKSTGTNISSPILTLSSLNDVRMPSMPVKTISTTPPLTRPLLILIRHPNNLSKTIQTTKELKVAEKTQ